MSDVVYVGEYRFLKELYYTDRHLWVRKELDGTLTLGVDDMGQKLAGKIRFIRLMREETSLEPKKVFGTMESMKWIERLTSPLTGIIKEANSNLGRRPTLINEDPYGAGWMIKIEPTGSVDKELSNLIHGEGLADWARKEIEEKAKKKS